MYSIYVYTCPCKDNKAETEYLVIWCCTTIKTLILQEPDNCISLHKNYNKYLLITVYIDVITTYM